MNNYSHIPVLLSEVLAVLEPQKNQKFVDATLGGGGYSKAILKLTAPAGQVLAIDLDQDALTNAQKTIKSKNLIVAHGNFSEIDRLVVKHKFNNISGIVADIGLSSYQLDESGRGITFQKNELLDMRFDQSSKQPDAKFLLNNSTPAELINIFKDFGEEKYAKEIARAVVKVREQKPFKYTSELVELIQSALPKPVKHKWSDSARRIFQALRIAVNHELENLESFLPKAFDLLAPGGKLAVVTFHSLEDRIVKQYFVGLTKGCVCPLEFPICKCGQNPQGKLLFKKPVTANPKELENNPRAKSAKLRAIQKL